MRSRCSTIIPALILTLTANCVADVQWFPGDHDAWFAAVGGESNVTTISFDELPNATTVSDEYSHLGVSFSGLNFTSGPFPSSYHDSWGLRVINGNHLYFSEPINWIAADIVGFLRFELYSENELFHVSPIFGVPPLAGFGGITSDRPFDHVRIYDPTDPLAIIDDLHFGPPIAVPAPGVLAPLGLLFCCRRTRRR